MCLIPNIERTEQFKSDPEFKGKQVVYKVLEIFESAIGDKKRLIAPMRQQVYAIASNNYDNYNEYKIGLNVSNRSRIDFNHDDDSYKYRYTGSEGLTKWNIEKGFHFCMDLEEALAVLKLLSQYSKKFVIVAVEVDPADFVAIGTFSDWNSFNTEHAEKSVVYMKCTLSEEEYNRALCA